jgi:DNA helicase IV
MPHPELASEQAYVDDAYRCLEAMRERTARVAELADSAAQAVDSAAAQWHLGKRLRSLDTDVPGLSFGRLDEDPDVGGDTWYVGRRHVEDAKGEPIVVDWRADVATPFYRATAADALGLRRRRRFLMTDRQVDDLFDEVFDDPDSVDAAHHGGIPDPLLAELERSRTGEMRDIVATIAAEQDLVIRASLDRCLVVQGGPGTGKTAVGLHRAAFLLYEHRRRLDNEGVLVIGPNPLFLRYISQVLPSLGETAVRQTTLDRLLAGTAYRVRARDTDPQARLKGDPRMATVLARAVAAQRRPVDGPLDARTGWGTVRLDADVVAAAIDEVVARGVAHNVGRNALRTQLLRLIRQELAERRGEELASSAALESRLRDDRDWQRALDRLWPTVGAAALVRKLLSSPTALRQAAGDDLDRDEQALLRRATTKRADDEPWTEADLPLLDEAQALVVGPPSAYGHVVVDEAQDLSAMGLRALARRCPTRSMTVLGDLAQATASGAQRSWDDTLAHLGSPATAQRVDLDLGYRVPAPIMDFANRLLPTAAPGVTPTASVRVDGRPPRLVRTGEAGDELVTELVLVVDELAKRWATVGVVAPDEVRRALPRDLDAQVVRPAEAKGLEFDAVVVVEPAAIGDADDVGRNLRLLYVALTRAVQELVVLHARPLPAELVA